MATVTFYEKPGCKTNARQKQMLEASGHTVVARSLLTEPWTEERLHSFFERTPVTSWFNPAAPRIKSGEIDPAAVDAVAALAIMVRDPLLIRRPLVEIGEQRCAGFDREPVTSLVGGLTDQDVEKCSRPGASTPCPDPVRQSKTSAA